jgi:hypothetical protein
MTHCVDKMIVVRMIIVRGGVGEYASAAERFFPRKRYGAKRMHNELAVPRQNSIQASIGLQLTVRRRAAARKCLAGAGLSEGREAIARRGEFIIWIANDFGAINAPSLSR